MENQDLSPPQVDTSRTSISFPLGIALLLLVFFMLSGVFDYCHHWHKFCSLRRQSLVSDHQVQRTQVQRTHIPMSVPFQFKPNPMEELKEEEKGQSMPVVMPGEEVATFIAMPSPYQPWLEETIVTIEKPPLKV